MEINTLSRINDDQHLVPDNTILIVTENDRYNVSVNQVMHSLRGEIKRDWFVKHAYYCLPLTIGNQYGFVIRSLFDFTAIWNGGPNKNDVSVHVNSNDLGGHQYITSHFGMGTITVQNRFHFRTPLGVNLLTMNPPNYFIPNLQNMTGVIETDNLRRDFTFNLRITSPNIEVKVKQGDWLAAIIPVPRFTVENYEIKLAHDVIDHQTIENERTAGRDFGTERKESDPHKPHGNGRRYANGVDIYDNPFHKHQKNL